MNSNSIKKILQLTFYYSSNKEKYLSSCFTLHLSHYWCLPSAPLVLGFRTICAEPLQIDQKREESFIKALFLSEEKRLVDKGRYQGEKT